MNSQTTLVNISQANTQTYVMLWAILPINVPWILNYSMRYTYINEYMGLVGALSSYDFVMVTNMYNTLTVVIPRV